MTRKTLLSWSSGKDSAWTLHVLRQRDEYEVVGLVTTFNEASHRVAMHGVRMELVEAQANATGLPLWSIPLPWPCTNEIYEAAMRGVVARAVSERISVFAFGDLFLEDIRSYRIRQLAGTGLEPIFPIWGTAADTHRLANEMIDAGLQATLACIDPNQLDPRFAGREFNRTLLTELPTHVDPCGERGEFHTFCHAGPMYDSPVLVQAGEILERDGFCFAELSPHCAT